MGSLCSKKTKPGGMDGATTSYATFNVNEPPSKASMWKHRIQGDEEDPHQLQRKVSFFPNAGAPNPRIQVTDTDLNSSRRLEEPSKPVPLLPSSPVMSSSTQEPPTPSSSNSNNSQRPPSPPVTLPSVPTRPQVQIPDMPSKQSKSKTSLGRKSHHRHHKHGSPLKKDKSSHRTLAKESEPQMPPVPSTVPSRRPVELAEPSDSMYPDDVSDPRLDFDPSRPGPTVLELGNNRQIRKFESNPPSRSVVKRPRTTRFGRSMSRIPGEKLRKMMMLKTQSSRAESQPSSSRPRTQDPSSKQVSSSSRPSSRKSNKSHTSYTVPSHKVSRSQSKQRTKSAKNKTSWHVKHEDSWTTFLSERRMRHHTKELPNRADHLTDPRDMARVEFDSRNGRLLRSMYRDWLNNNEQENTENGCQRPMSSRSAAHACVRLPNEVLDRMLDSMCLAVSSSAPGCACKQSRPCSQPKPC